MMMCQQFPRIQYVSPCGLSLCPLVSWTVICGQDGCFMVRQMRIAEEHLSHNFDEHCLEDIGVTWCLSYPRVGAPFLGHYVSW